IDRMISAIIVAAGSGTRMGDKVDKLFLEVANRPIIAHTWDRYDRHELVTEIVLVVREGQQTAFGQLASRCNFRKPHRIVVGGAERQDSVWNGLQALSSEADVVAIQDGARPCTSARVITATLEAARQNGAAVTAQRMSDTVKQSDDGLFISRHLDRSKFWAV